MCWQAQPAAGRRQTRRAAMNRLFISVWRGMPEPLAYVRESFGSQIVLRGPKPVDPRFVCHDRTRCRAILEVMGLDRPQPRLAAQGQPV